MGLWTLIFEEDNASKESPSGLVLSNSRLKALSVSDRLPENHFALSADTVVVIDKRVLGKPVDVKDAKRMLGMLSGRTHSVITGFSIIDSAGNVLHNEAVATLVTVKMLEEFEIEGYIKTDEPMDKAGAYGIQGIGSFMIEEIDGSYTNVVGLPVCQVAEALSRLDIISLF